MPQRIAGASMGSGTVGSTTAYFPTLFVAFAVMGLGMGTAMLPLMTIARPLSTKPAALTVSRADCDSELVSSHPNTRQAAIAAQSATRRRRWAGVDGCLQRRIVGQAKVAPEPDDGPRHQPALT